MGASGVAGEQQDRLFPMRSELGKLLITLMRRDV